MFFLKRYFSIFLIILSVLAVYTKDSNISVIKSSDFLKNYESNDKINSSDSKDLQLKSKSFQQRAGFGASSGGDLFKEFWHSLYVDRTFNSSFALNIPLFTITVPGYGRGLKYETPLSAINVGMSHLFLNLLDFGLYFVSIFDFVVGMGMVVHFRQSGNGWHTFLFEYSLMGAHSISRTTHN